jgi:hypothetical protein
MRSCLRRVIVVTAATLAVLPTSVSLLKAQRPYPVRCGTGISSTEGGYVPLPRGDVFCPLVADPKATRSFASVLSERSDSITTSTSLTLASVGIGDRFGIGRWNGANPGDGIQLSLSAGVFAQFDLGTNSYDLLNADYVIGLPLSIRSGWFSTRIRFYHQSSHLGDEYLLRDPPGERQRENISFESIEWLISADASALRIYGGGEYLFDRSPDDLEHYVAHGGLELRPQLRVIPLGGLGGFRFVAAGDLKASQEQDWKPSVSVRAGLEYDRADDGDPSARRWGIFFQYYTGPSPYGQFFRADVRHIGAGIHFGGF